MLIHRRPRRERHRAAGVARAAAARNDGQSRVRCRRAPGPAISASVSGVSTTNGILDAPVGGVGDVRDARVGIEPDVVLARVPRPSDRGARLAHLGEFRKSPVESPHRVARRPTSELRRALSPRRRHPVGSARRFSTSCRRWCSASISCRAALRVVEQIVLQVGFASHHPDVAEHLVQHARRAAGAPLGAQLIEQVPRLLAQQPYDDFTVRERGVVVGDLPQSRNGKLGVGSRRGAGDCGGSSAHGPGILTAFNVPFASTIVAR